MKLFIILSHGTYVVRANGLTIVASGSFYRHYVSPTVSLIRDRMSNDIKLTISTEEPVRPHLDGHHY